MSNADNRETVVINEGCLSPNQCTALMSVLLHYHCNVERNGTSITLRYRLLDTAAQMTCFGIVAGFLAALKV